MKIIIGDEFTIDGYVYKLIHSNVFTLYIEDDNFVWQKTDAIPTNFNNQSYSDVERELSEYFHRNIEIKNNNFNIYKQLSEEEIIEIQDEFLKMMDGVKYGSRLYDNLINIWDLIFNKESN